MKALTITPIQATQQKLTNMMLSAPFTLDLATSSLLVVRTAMAPAPDLDRNIVYSDVRIENVRLKRLGEATEYTPVSLIAMCSSESLMQRCKQLGLNVTGEFNWILKNDFPPGRSSRVFLSSLTDMLIYREGPYEFSNETLE